MNRRTRRNIMEQFKSKINKKINDDEQSSKKKNKKESHEEEKISKKEIKLIIKDEDDKEVKNQEIEKDITLETPRIVEEVNENPQDEN